MTPGKALVLTLTDKERKTLREWVRYPRWLREPLVTLFVMAKIAEQELTPPKRKGSP